MNEEAAGRNYLEEARVPLDFAKEILPGAISEVPKAGPPEPEMPAPSAQDKRKSRRPKRFPVIRQVDESDCGVACLAMIAAWHGIEVPLSWLREVAGTDRSGTTLRALAVTGRRIGLEVEPVKLSRDRARPPASGDPALGRRALGGARPHRRATCRDRRSRPRAAANGPQ